MFSQGPLSNFVISLKNKHFQAILSLIALLIILLFSLFAGWPVNYAIGAGLTIVLIYSVLNWPRNTLFALIFFRMLLDYPGENFFIGIGKNFSISFSQAIGGVIFAAGAMYIAQNWRHLKSVPLKLPLLIYFIFSAFTAFYSIDALSTLKELLRFFDLGFLFFLSYSATQDRKDFDKLLKIIFLSSLIPILAGIYQFIFGIGYTDSAFAAPRIFGTFSHPNSFSLVLSAIILLAILYYFLDKKVSKKIWIYVFIAALLITLVLTYTRIAWIALFSGLAILGAVKYRKLLIGIVAASLLIYLLVPFVQERIYDATSASSDSSFTWRKNLWKDMVSETLGSGKQYLGYGVNTFEQVTESKRGIQFGSTAAHNDFVRAFVEGGVVGLSVYIFFIAYLLIFIFRKYKTSSSENQKIFFLVMFSLFAAMIVASFTDNVIRNTPLQWILWIVIGAGLKVFGNTGKLKIKNV